MKMFVHSKQLSVQRNNNNIYIYIYNNNINKHNIKLMPNCTVKFAACNQRKSSDAKLSAINQGLKFLADLLDESKGYSPWPLLIITLMS